MSNSNRLPRGTSKDGIRKHYDTGNEFFGCFLGDTMVYSCALWDGATDLDSAQFSKLDYMNSLAKATDSERMLDVGCGWGLNLRRLRQQFGVKDVTGLTLSEAQAEFIEKQHKLDGVSVRVEDWQDHVPDRPYNGIVSIGAFEHFARMEHSLTERIECYSRFFEWANRVSVSRARLALQTFAYAENRTRQEAHGAHSTRFLSQEIFRETDPPKLAEIIDASAPWFEVVSLRNDRNDYARTCAEWISRLGANHAEAVRVGSEEEYDRFMRYLRMCELAFRSGKMCLYRIGFSRRR